MRCSKIVTLLREEAVRKDVRIAELEDRLMANNLAEFHAARSIAMPVEDPTPSGYWASDPTGLVREWIADDAPHE